eukprot:TRINITY_DN32183_c0_g1_i2.p1 TRINITY_DN32183_c0_g1~~TRINITY_DN32183_c0_g1_i2.p1  ORF type:complete len:473 (+),score=53.41 TRINITY_DN32183_c0_g1_i2:132-1550(+)
MIDYDEDYLHQVIFTWRGKSVWIRALQWAIPASILSLFMVLLDDVVGDLRETAGFMGANKSQLWSAGTVSLFAMLGFRTSAAHSRFWEGTTLLHQMRGEWFDAVSCCVTFTTSAVCEKFDKVQEFRHTIVRLMSLCHASALEEISGLARGNLTTIDTMGLDKATLKYLNACAEDYNFNRVEALLHMTQTLIVTSLDSEVIKVPPPILSRVFQTLSRGFVNLLNCKKITDTRFPFPYAQLLAVLLSLHVVCTPIVITALFEKESRYWAPIFTFIPVYAMHCINFIAVELENPFGDDENDLPLDHFQEEMNNCLIMLLQDEADLIPGVKTNYIRSFATLKFQLDGTGIEDVERHDPCRSPRSKSPSRCSQRSFAIDDFMDDNPFDNPSLRSPDESEISPHNSMRASPRHSLTLSRRFSPTASENGFSNEFTSGPDVVLEMVKSDEAVPKSPGNTGGHVNGSSAHHEKEAHLRRR